LNGDSNEDTGGELSSCLFNSLRWMATSNFERPGPRPAPPSRDALAECVLHQLTSEQRGAQLFVVAETPFCRIVGLPNRWTSSGFMLVGRVRSSSMSNDKEVRGHDDEDYRSSEDSEPKPHPRTHPTLPIDFLRPAISKSPTHIKAESNDNAQKSGQ
jgi:hypothetical protein